MEDTVILSNTPIHRVVRGDTLTSLAREYRVSIDNLVEWNRLANRDETIYREQTLIVDDPFFYDNIEIPRISQDMARTLQAAGKIYYGGELPEVVVTAKYKGTSLVGNIAGTTHAWGDFALGAWGSLHTPREWLEKMLIAESKFDNALRVKFGEPTQSINTNIKTIQRVGKWLNRAGHTFTAADVAMSGEVRVSHLINTGAVFGSKIGVGVIWFIADYGTMGANYLLHREAKGLGDMIDEWVGGPLIELYDGIY